MSKYYGLIDLGIVIVAVLGIGLWQLRSVNKSIAEDKAKAEAKED